jgi:hypothetical protein
VQEVEFAFFAGHAILISTPSFLALTVNELCLLFLLNPYATSCFLLHIFPAFFGRYEICL